MLKASDFELGCFSLVFILKYKVTLFFFDDVNSGIKAGEFDF